MLYVMQFDSLNYEEFIFPICYDILVQQAAVDSITKSLALEWGTDYDIRVNGIAPGPIEGTPGLRKLAPEEMKVKLREAMPLFKMGERWDIAMAAVYLASDAGCQCARIL